MPNRLRPRPLLVPALLAVLAGCATPNPPARARDPFQVGREVVAPLRVVALAPLRAPKDLQDTEAVRIRLIATVEARLRDAGLAVIAPSEVQPIFDEVMAWRDGLFDPKTGKLDQARVKGALEEATERLTEKFGRVDAFVFARLDVMGAPLDTDWAAWNGTTQYAGASGWKRVFFLNRHSGSLRALSLTVSVLGKDGRTLYLDRGGLQLLEKVDVWGKRVPVPRAELLADEVRNATAVYLATDALVAGLRQPPGAAAPVPVPPAPPPVQAAPPEPPPSAPPPVAPPLASPPPAG